MAIIYHYCSPETFQKIIENKTLWLSATNNMNDFSEGKWVEDALGRVLRKIANEKNKKWCEELWITMVSNNQPTYVACFSKDGDILSQWRAYAQDGEGVAIGFDEECLNLETGRVAFNIDIDKSMKINEIEYINDDDVEIKIQNILNKESLENSLGIVTDLVMDLGFLAVTAKSPAFKEEKEKRIIYKPLILINEGEKHVLSIDHGREIKYRISNGYLISYFEFQFSPESIKEIILGPKNKFSQHDMDKFMYSNKLGKTKIKQSKATYR
ncbi:DUF2971 domain-containing protein [Pectobacterium versatile]|uniref:DUF2971 domain-containing protein n=1 Tax=Pectobacterium versatile TaxID=2488639 RepID=UPI00102E611A|nr:DUF2971 domain-containing protein [Pectobacterium versatile]TAI99394.1 DUF2971 domain-containing protein [Pectobacterium versatile]UEQ07827.1 DUF2971 domain-containing protein [Pectobacterium versatile]